MEPSRHQNLNKKSNNSLLLFLNFDRLCPYRENLMVKVLKYQEFLYVYLLKQLNPSKGEPKNKLGNIIISLLS